MANAFFLPLIIAEYDFLRVCQIARNIILLQEPARISVFKQLLLSFKFESLVGVLWLTEKTKREIL